MEVVVCGNESEQNVSKFGVGW